MTFFRIKTFVKIKNNKFMLDLCRLMLDVCSHWESLRTFNVHLKFNHDAETQEDANFCVFRSFHPEFHSHVSETKIYLI